jgi:predicted glycogen debranching enzyme
LIIGRQACGNWDEASRLEWLVTNGLGGYACGTIAAAHTRRYHGLLMASLAPAGMRMLLVSKVDVSAAYQGERFELSANEFADGTLSPKGFVHLESFAVIDGIPTWEYALGDALLQQKIFMAPGENTSYLRLKLMRATAPVSLKLRPLVSYRDYHSHQRGARPFEITREVQGCKVQPPDAAPAFHLRISRGEFQAAGDWYWNFFHREEQARGLDAVEDLFHPGEFTAELAPGESLHFLATAEDNPPRDGEELLKQLRDQAKALTSSFPRSTPSVIRGLALAAQQFVVRRLGSGHGPRDLGAMSIIAGYPWFGDWGRDTMISLPGLATALQRYDVTASVLRTYAKYLDGGMLPNRFPDFGEAPEYNTADATLWMFHAFDDYLRAKPDPELARELYPVLVSVIRAHQAGTRFGIGVDPKDGLLKAGEHGTQLTWMDAKCGDQVFTPRVGKPVEINALWLNALEVTTRLAARLRAPEKNLFQSLLTQASASFAAFWNESTHCLYDVLDLDGGSEKDPRIRPNQILALSLPYCPLTREQMRSIVDVCGRELLTSYGLRSLSPKDPGFVGCFTGDQRARDAAYHMGTVWSWLLGPFARAHYRVYQDARLALSFLAPIQQHLEEACVGSVSEVFDGDAPHSARGCFAQAWSVAEILRAWLYLERRISTP